MNIGDLTYEQRWSLFRGMACDVLRKHGYRTDVWDMASSLDMSFEEYDKIPLEEWEAKLNDECLEYKRECRIYFQ